MTIDESIRSRIFYCYGLLSSHFICLLHFQNLIRYMVVQIPLQLPFHIIHSLSCMQVIVEVDLKLRPILCYCILIDK